ncbi:hypothetical protein [Candidatus Skiveiella danica]|uniref:hypothetical protein n=1 Tax=Candidatus Skiveiella danica TaxID=3386177 RepID=UPI001D8AFB1C|nr:hypothetical protein [Betaproteobacteria bacterium]
MKRLNTFQPVAFAAAVVSDVLFVGPHFPSTGRRIACSHPAGTVTTFHPRKLRQPGSF